MAGLAILARSGHAINLEEPEQVNRLLEGFLQTVEAGDWVSRDVPTMPQPIWGRLGSHEAVGGPAGPAMHSTVKAPLGAAVPGGGGDAAQLV